ncbi:2-oxoacid:acceptor oxidoreductase subunit alpha [Porphyromonas cangingivalis]|uniref:2-oxoacid:acceptor oxidoreductase subunit alpha n=1 Tax=Porphyromonas cangingivalis TaxID=36874 RepID=UPI00051D3AD1|nr:2-oxoacid:acceptor oxidoreductase subunit alpha [Porphyromonas cangingivalis]KGL47522.1 MFS transporter [Porphyromonas cangingivalis]
MNQEPMIESREEIVIRFSGDSGDGMQLTGSLFSDVSAILGNEISTFPDYPAEIRAPQGTLSGVSGFQVRIGTSGILTPGDYADVLVAMNPAALKVNALQIKKNAIVLIDQDSFAANDLQKALFTSGDPFAELGLDGVEVLSVPVTTMIKDSLKDSGLDMKGIVRCKNMFALGLICWLFGKDITPAEDMLAKKFGKKQDILRANIKALVDGYNYGANTHLSAKTYRIEANEKKALPGHYVDINGNKATALGLVAASEKSGRELFLGSYPITPATDILHELSKFKAMGVKTVQAEDEIAGICTAIGASYAGDLAVTTTSGPGLALKSEALGLAMMTELPLVIVDVMRGGPSTGLPTKSEQSDLLQALYGRNGESPIPVVAPLSPADCFDTAFMAAKIALEHMTPVIMLSDAYVANGATAWRVPEIDSYPEIKPPYADQYTGEAAWKPYFRNEETKVRYWGIPGMKGFAHRVGGLEKDNVTSVISTDPDNHQLMVNLREEKVRRIAHDLPLLEVFGDQDADNIIVGWGSTYGHLHSAMTQLRKEGRKVAFAQFKFIKPLPLNAEEVLSRFKNVIVCEQSMGQFAKYLGGELPHLNILRFNRVKGQPFKVARLVEEIGKIMDNNA